MIRVGGGGVRNVCWSVFGTGLWRGEVFEWVFMFFFGLWSGFLGSGFGVRLGR